MNFKKTLVFSYILFIFLAMPGVSLAALEAPLFPIDPGMQPNYKGSVQSGEFSQPAPEPEDEAEVESVIDSAVPSNVETVAADVAATSLRPLVWIAVIIALFVGVSFGVYRNKLRKKKV